MTTNNKTIDDALAKVGELGTVGAMKWLAAKLAERQEAQLRARAVPVATDAFENYFCMTLSDDDSESVSLYDACKAAASDAWNEATRRAIAQSQPVAQAAVPDDLTHYDLEYGRMTPTPDGRYLLATEVECLLAILQAPQPQVVDEAMEAAASLCRRISQHFSGADTFGWVEVHSKLIAAMAEREV